MSLWIASSNLSTNTWHQSEHQPQTQPWTSSANGCWIQLVHALLDHLTCSLCHSQWQVRVDISQARASLQLPMILRGCAWRRPLGASSNWARESGVSLIKLGECWNPRPNGRSIWPTTTLRYPPTKWTIKIWPVSFCCPIYIVLSWRAKWD